MKVIEISKEDLKYNLNIINNLLNKSEDKVRVNSCCKSKWDGVRFSKIF